jgi:polyribonucleotide nucleotidyltransferase
MEDQQEQQDIAIEDNQPIQAPRDSKVANIVGLPKVKRPLNQKQLENLAKGRENAKLRREQLKKNKEDLITQLAIKKANNMIKSKLKLKKEFGLEDADDDEEDIIVPIQPKKPKKKQVVYLPPESDSEEEIVYKKELPATRRPKQKAPQSEQIQVMPERKLVFY